MASLRYDIEQAINRNNAEGPSNTPDFILAEFLTECLAAFDRATQARAWWYGHMDAIGGPIPMPPVAMPSETHTCNPEYCQNKKWHPEKYPPPPPPENRNW